MTIDKQELRRLAEGATPGEWRAENQHTDSHPFYVMSDRLIGAVCKIPRSTKAPVRGNAEFIAAANPAVVLELLDDLHSTESRLHEVASACATAEQERDRLREIAMRLVDLQNSGRGPIRTFTLWNDIANRARQVLGLEVRNG